MHNYPIDWADWSPDEKYEYTIAFVRERMQARMDAAKAKASGGKPECRKTPLTNKSGKITKPATIACGSVCRQPKNCDLSKSEQGRIAARVGNDPEALRRAILQAKRKKRQGSSGTGAVYEATKEALGQQGRERLERKKQKGENRAKSLEQVAPEPSPTQPKIPNARPKSQWEPLDEPATLDQLRDLRKRMREGGTSAAEIQHQYARFKASEESLRSELSKKTLVQLQKEFFSYHKLKKAQHVDRAISMLGQSFNPNDTWTHYSSKEERAHALDQAVAGWTDDRLAAKLAKHAKEREENEDKVRRIKNPETLEDFGLYLQYRKIEDLPPEKRRLYEDLKAEKDRGGRQERREQDRQQRRGADATPGQRFTVTQSKHTKTGETLHLVKMGDRVGKDEFGELRSAAKGVGGFWSRYDRAFRFPSAEVAQKFAKDHDSSGEKPEGGTAEPSGGGAVADTPEIARKKKLTATLRGKSARVREVAQETLNQERLTNTARRSRMASDIQDRARKDLLIADTMDNIAQAIEDNEVKFIDRLRDKTQFETFEHLLGRAKYKRLGYSAYKEDPSESLSEEDVDMVEFPYPKIYGNSMYYSQLDELAKAKGGKQAAARIRKRLKGSDDRVGVTFSTPQEIADIAKLAAIAGNHTGISYYMKEYNRLMAMDITNTTELRAALREYIKFRGEKQKEDPVKALERALVGQKGVGIDYFPTPKPMAADMAKWLKVEPGMKVLEPSAGSGYLADAVMRETGGAADITTVEVSHRLGELLRAKGYNPVQEDFLEFQEGKGEYDRIIMNPPFSKGADIDHVRHAYDLLKPGGRMVAIMSEGPFFREGKKDQEFRGWLESVGGKSQKNPEGAFKSSDMPTGVNTRRVLITKPLESRADSFLPGIYLGFGLNPNPFDKPLWRAMGIA